MENIPYETQFKETPGERDERIGKIIEQLGTLKEDQYNRYKEALKTAQRETIDSKDLNYHNEK